MKHVFNIQHELIKYINYNIPRGWVGINRFNDKHVLYNDKHSPHFLPILLDREKIDPITLCKIGWDLGVESPRGYNINSTYDPELGFLLYLDDFDQQKEHLADEIWKILDHNNHIVFVTDNNVLSKETY